MRDCVEEGSLLILGRGTWPPGGRFLSVGMSSLLYLMIRECYV
jgi:hypothetical protein